MAKKRTWPDGAASAPATRFARARSRSASSLRPAFVASSSAHARNALAAARAAMERGLEPSGEPADAANMVGFLASDAASWITGQTYPVNGGYSFAV